MYLPEGTVAGPFPRAPTFAWMPFVAPSLKNLAAAPVETTQTMNEIASEATGTAGRLWGGDEAPAVVTLRQQQL